MQDLHELVVALSSNRVDRIETFTEEKHNKGTLYYKLYKALEKGEIKSDEDAQIALYGKVITNSRFKMLKKRFSERMYTTMLFLLPRENEIKSYSRELYYCYKYFAVAKLLRDVSASQAATTLFKKIIGKALRYEFFDLVELCALDLRRDCMRQGKVKQFEYYDKLFEYAQQVVYAEALAERHNYEIQIHFTKTFAQRPELATSTEKAILEIDDLRKFHNTFKLNNFYYTTKLLWLELLNDYDSALAIVNEYEQYILNKPVFYTKARHANILLRKVDLYLHTGQFREGIETAEKALGFYQKGRNNWFTLLELYFLTALNINNIDKAAELYHIAVTDARYEHLLAQQQEIWRVYGGYLWLICRQSDRADLLRKYFGQSENFRISKLVNEVPLFSKDKQGLNVSILILQILILMLEEDYVSVIQRTEALRTYAYDNLKRKEAIRNYCFLDLLIRLIKSDFNPSKMKSKTKAIFQRMQQEKVNYNSTQTRMEVLPYEQLWKMILNMLEIRNRDGKEKAASFTEAA